MFFLSLHDPGTLRVRGSTYTTTLSTQKLHSNHFDMAKKVVLVTGGTGLIGSAIAELVETNSPTDEEWIFCSSKDADLCDTASTASLFALHKPTHVIHLAARVGGLFANMSHNLDFFRDNLEMNNNVYEECRKWKVQKLVSCLSTCIFPEHAEFPVDETNIHDGPPHRTNAGYAYAKRMMEVQNRLYREQYGCNFTSIIPSNVFGKHDNFHLESSHVIPGLIHRCYTCKKQSNALSIYGSGTPLRQFIFAPDLAKVFIWALDHYEDAEPLIVSGGTENEFSISYVAEVVTRCLDFHGKLSFDVSRADGVLKKTASDHKMRRLIPEFQFTPFEDAISATVQWFTDNYDNLQVVRR